MVTPGMVRWALLDQDNALHSISIDDLLRDPDSVGLGEVSSSAGFYPISVRSWVKLHPCGEGKSDQWHPQSDPLRLAGGAGQDARGEADPAVEALWGGVWGQGGVLAGRRAPPEGVDRPRRPLVRDQGEACQ